MQSKENKKTLGIRETAARKRELKQIALDRETTMQGLWERAIESYLSGPAGCAAPNRFPDARSSDMDHLEEFYALLKAASREETDSIMRIVRLLTQRAT